MARCSAPGIPALAPEDTVAIAGAFLASVHVRSLAVADRQLCFGLLLALAQVSRPSCHLSLVWLLIVQYNMVVHITDTPGLSSFGLLWSDTCATESQVCQQSETKGLSTVYAASYSWLDVN